MPVALQVLLLDEITVDLDVLARADFLKFLIEDCETRGMTVVYVSPIFLQSLPLVALPRPIKIIPTGAVIGTPSGMSERLECWR